MIKLDYKNCLSEKVGPHRIKPQEFEPYFKNFPKIHSTIIKKSQDTSLPLGWLKLPFDQEVDQINRLATRLRWKFENFVVVGIGGSALGNIALQSALRDKNWNSFSKKQRDGWLKLYVLDNIDPTTIKSFLENVDIKKTVINVISKAGNTVESLATFFILYDALVKKVGTKNVKKHIIISTDKEKGFLREVVNKGLCEESFVIPSNVGGRFSVLSPVGLVSAACTGIDIKKLLSGAKSMALSCGINFKKNSKVKTVNPAYIFATINHILYKKNKKLCVMFSYSDKLYSFADWFRQLWAESLGKAKDNTGKIVNIGPTPIKALGVTDQHSQVQLYREGPNDKLIVFLSVENFGVEVKIPPFVPQIVGKHYLSGHTLNELIKAEELGTRVSLTKALRPNVTITFKKIDEYSVGEFIYMLELATAYAGEMFNINAFDQPGVELAKNYTYALLGRTGYEKFLKEIKE
jgi:glucose-6-phosphate isomerase